MRWTTRFRGGRRDPEVALQAHTDLVAVMKEGIESLQSENAQLRTLLATAQMSSWMWHGVARRHQAAAFDPNKTVVMSKRALHAATEHMPRRHR